MLRITAIQDPVCCRLLIIVSYRRLENHVGSHIGILPGGGGHASSCISSFGIVIETRSQTFPVAC